MISWNTTRPDELRISRSAFISRSYRCLGSYDVWKTLRSVYPVTALDPKEQGLLPRAWRSVGDIIDVFFCFFFAPNKVRVLKKKKRKKSLVTVVVMTMQVSKVF